MKGKLIVLPTLASGLVLLTSVATAHPSAAKQRVEITTFGVATTASVQKFEFGPLSPGRLKPDLGTSSSVMASRRIVTRDGQPAEIVTWITRQEGRRGSFVVRARIEHIDAGKGFHIGTGTWTFVRGTGDYAGLKGGGRVANAWIEFGPHGLSERWDGFLTAASGLETGGLGARLPSRRLRRALHPTRALDARSPGRTYEPVCLRPGSTK